MAKVTVEFILGLIGGILGILGSLLVIAQAVSYSQWGFLSDNIKQTASILLVSGFLAFLFSILGIVGSALVSTKRRKIAGWLIVISAFGGLILISLYYALAFIFLIIAGVMALIQKKEDKTKDIESKETIPFTVGSSIIKTAEDTKKDSVTKNYIDIVLRVIRLFFVFIFLLVGFSLLLTGKLTGVLWILIGLIWIHPFIRKISQITNFKFTRTIKIILTIVLLLFAIMLSPRSVDREYSTTPDNNIYETVKPLDKTELQKKITICEKTIYKKDDCFFKLALELENAELCEKLPEWDYSVTKGSCIIQIAKKTLNYSLCEKAGRKENRCYEEIAVAKKDPALCEKLSYEILDLTSKDYCYDKLAREMADYSLCERIKEESSLKDSCYYNISLTLKNPLICKKMTNKYSWYSRDNCYRNIAISKSDSSLCEEVESNNVKDNCYRDIAIAKNEQTLCGNIKEDAIRDSCYTDINNLLKNSLLCEKIKDSVKKDWCYLELAKSKNEFILCEKINDDLIKKSCYSG